MEKAKTGSHRILLWVCIVLVILAMAAVMLRRPVRSLMIRWRLAPANPFAQMKPPPAPDYAQLSSWAAHPKLKDYADFNPRGVARLPGKRRADVFFVYPTTYLSKQSWNAAIDEKKSKYRVDSAVMKHQAAAFNGCCEIYAPRYRQATLYFAFGFEPDGKQALALAYADVVRAFLYYLKHWNKGRPFILAGHSQGAIHALRLLEEHVVKATHPLTHAPLHKQLIAAYIVGQPVHKDKFQRTLKPLTVCQTPTSTGCVISWMTFGPKGHPEGYSKLPKYYPPKGYEQVLGRPHICVNPLSWKAEDPYAPASMHLGAVRYKRGKVPPDPPIVGVVEGGCKHGAMFIKKPKLKKGFNRFLFGPDDYHIYDFNLFFMNIRANAIARTQAFFTKK